LSSGSPPIGLLAEFAGAVACESLRGGRDLRLSGRALARNTDGGGQGNAAPQPAQLLLCEVRPTPGASALPTLLHELIARVCAAPQSAGGGVSLQLAALEGVFVVGVRAARLHRDASQPFFRVVPPPRVPVRTRAGWALLLRLLRLPPLYKRLIRSSKPWDDPDR
jgi:hypothetical protein